MKFVVPNDWTPIVDLSCSDVVAADSIVAPIGSAAIVDLILLAPPEEIPGFGVDSVFAAATVDSA